MMVNIFQKQYFWAHCIPWNCHFEIQLLKRNGRSNSLFPYVSGLIYLLVSKIESLSLQKPRVPLPQSIVNLFKIPGHFPSIIVILSNKISPHTETSLSHPHAMDQNFINFDNNPPNWYQENGTYHYFSNGGYASFRCDLPYVIDMSVQGSHRFFLYTNLELGLFLLVYK